VIWNLASRACYCSEEKVPEVISANPKQIADFNYTYQLTKERQLIYDFLAT